MRLLPPPLHRSALRLAHRLRVLWWRWRRPLVEGVCIIARDGAGRVLLIRQSYGRGGWTLPGGGIRRGEDPAHAAAREFAEELRCALTALTLLAVREENLHGARNRVHLFAARLEGEPRPDGREVVAARLFDLKELPPGVSELARRRLALLRD